MYDKTNATNEHNIMVNWWHKHILEIIWHGIRFEGIAYS